MIDAVMEKLQAADTSNRYDLASVFGRLHIVGMDGCAKDLGASILRATTPLKLSVTYFEYIRGALVANDVVRANLYVKEALQYISSIHV